MRLITLNTWAGRIYEPLIQFLSDHRDDTDIFCFQEIFHTESENQYVGPEPQVRVDLFDQIQAALGDEFYGYHSPVQLGYADHGPVDFHLLMGNATFVRRNLELVETEEVFVYRDGLTTEPSNGLGLPRSIQITNLKQNGQDYIVVNFHGLWQEGTAKQDNPHRVEQSQRIKQALSKYAGKPIVICGDFNLMPDGQSMQLLEEGMRNLVKEYGVTSTRSSYYPSTKPTRFADYILVSAQVKINNFEVLKDEVSDHLPLRLDFS